MDLGQLTEQSKTKIRTATIKWIGEHNKFFGTEKAGDLINKEVEVHHVLPHTDNFISHPDHCHAIVKLPTKFKTDYLLDLKLDFGSGNSG